MAVKTALRLPASLMVLLAACRGEPAPVRPVHFADLAFGDAAATVRSSRGAPRVDWFFCGDQYRRGLWLEDGERLSFPLPVPLEPAAAALTLRLALVGCLRRDPEQHGPGAGELVVRALNGAGRATELGRLPLPRFRWWDHEVDLGGLAGHATTLEVEAVLAPGVHAYLKDAYVATEAPARLPRTDPGPQVLLVVVDTLRADALSAYGGGEATPGLDALAADSELFLRHYAAAPWTKPSHASLLTGQPAAAHGVGAEDVVPAALPLLAELAQQRGLDTGALVYECGWLSPRFGWSRGFDRYQVDHSQLSTQVRSAVNWIAERRERPFFFFLHTFETHSDFTILPYEGRGATRLAVEQKFGIDHYGCLPDETCASMRLMRIDRGEFAPLPGESEVLRFLYGRGVQEADRQLAVLFAALRVMGMFERMMIVVTSDHGEMLLEHGGLFHSGSREEVLRVPLLVKWPGNRRAGERNPALTASIDLVPTILGQLGVTAEGYPGRDLAGPAGAERALVVGDTERAVWRDRWKARFAGDGAELWDLEADPEELEDLAAREPGVVGELRALVAQHDRAGAALRARLGREQSALSEEDRERLRALGYLDSPTPRVPE